MAAGASPALQSCPHYTHIHHPDPAPQSPFYGFAFQRARMSGRRNGGFQSRRRGGREPQLLAHLPLILQFTTSSTRNRGTQGGSAVLMEPGVAQRRPQPRPGGARRARAAPPAAPDGALVVPRAVSSLDRNHQGADGIEREPLNVLFTLRMALCRASSSWGRWLVGHGEGAVLGW
jgi:hypothetical protein